MLIKLERMINLNISIPRKFKFFVVPPKFDQNDVFQKFEKSLALISKHFGERDFMWTIGRKIGFSREFQIQPN
jgi:hypothetical protein